MNVFEYKRGEAREATIMRWYEEVFPLAAAHIRRMGGDLEEAKEVFQESLIIACEKLLQTDFQPEINDKAYLMGIVKNQWLKYRKQFNASLRIDQFEIPEQKSPELLTHKLVDVLKSSGEKCMDLLQSFYYEKLNMKQIAHRFGYTSERSATVQKYKCLEKIRNEVKQKSLCYEDFLD